MINYAYAFYMPLNTKKIAGENLKTILDRVGISQNKLAELLGVQPPYVNAIVKGKRGIGHKIMPKLCDLLGVRPAEFFYEATSTIVTDEEEKEIIQNIRKSPELKRQIAAISDALAQQYDAPKSGKGDAVSVPREKRKGVKGRRTA